MQSGDSTWNGWVIQPDIVSAPAADNTSISNFPDIFTSRRLRGKGSSIKKLNIRLLPHFRDHLLMFAQSFLPQQGIQDIRFNFG